MDKLILSLNESEGIEMPKDKKREAKTKSTLSSMQEVTYSREFKKADRAGGFDTNTKY